MARLRADGRREAQGGERACSTPLAGGAGARRLARPAFGAPVAAALAILLRAPPSGAAEPGGGAAPGDPGLAEPLRRSLIARGGRAAGTKVHLRLAPGLPATSSRISKIDEGGIAISQRGVTATVRWTAVSDEELLGVSWACAPAAPPDVLRARLLLAVRLGRSGEDAFGRDLVALEKADAAAAAAVREARDAAARNTAARRASPETPGEPEEPGESDKGPERGGRKPKGPAPYVYADAHVRECRLGIDIGYSAFEKHYGKSEEKVKAAVDELIKKLNTYWISEVMIQWKLGALVVRKTPAEDPHDGLADSGRMWGDTRRLFLEQKRLDFGIKVSSLLDVGGLGGGRCAVLLPSWFAFDHEVSHGFGLPHEHGWPYERGPQNIRSTYSLYGDVPKHPSRDPGDAPGLWYGDGKEHTFSAKDVEDMMREVRGLADLGASKDPLPPYAAMDVVRVPVTPGRKSYTVPLDVLANDHDCNNGPIVIKEFDAATPRGARVSRAGGRGPGGRDVLRYDFPAKLEFSMHDLFGYTIADAEGLENRGSILVIFETPNLIANGDFEAGNPPWQGTNAFVEPVGGGRARAHRLRLAGGAEALAKQAVALAPGASYRLTLACEMPQGQTLTVGLTGKSGKGPGITKVLRRGWRMRAFYFSAAAGVDAGTVVVSRPAGGAGDCFVDDVELRAVGPQEAAEYAAHWPKDAEE